MSVTRAELTLGVLVPLWDLAPEPEGVLALLLRLGLGIAAGLWTAGEGFGRGRLILG